MKRSTPPMTYWRKEDKLSEEERLRQAEQAMDTIGIIAGIIAAIGFITVLAANERIYWLPPIIAVATAVWWLGWRRKRND
jgi:hypothetical protein